MSSLISFVTLLLSKITCPNGFSLWPSWNSKNKNLSKIWNSCANLEKWTLSLSYLVGKPISQAQLRWAEKRLATENKAVHSEQSEMGEWRQSFEEAEVYFPKVKMKDKKAKVHFRLSSHENKAVHCEQWNKARKG